MKTYFLIATTLCMAAANAQEPELERGIKRGNDLYKQQQYQQAEAAYNEVLAKDAANKTAQFNKVNAQYRQGRNSEAIKTLNDLAFKSEDAANKARAYYNKGAILSAQKRLEESIEAYKEALRKDPNDRQARENLQKALLELKKKEPPKKDDDKKKQQQQQQQKKQQQQPKMNQREAQQRLKLLEQKEKDVQQRLQKERSKQGGGQLKDW